MWCSFKSNQVQSFYFICICIGSFIRHKVVFRHFLSLYVIFNLFYILYLCRFVHMILLCSESLAIFETYSLIGLLFNKTNYFLPRIFLKTSLFGIWWDIMVSDIVIWNWMLGNKSSEKVNLRLWKQRCFFIEHSTGSPLYESPSLSQSCSYPDHIVLYSTQLLATLLTPIPFISPLDPNFVPQKMR